MSSALFFKTHDEAGQEINETFEEFELNKALATFLVATYENEYAELRWSS